MKYFPVLFTLIVIANSISVFAQDGVPFMGVVMKDNTTKVMSVVEDSPAQKAGIKIDDVLLAINKEPVTTNSQLIMKIYSYKAGDTVTVEFKRDKKHKTVKVKLTERTDKYTYMFKNLPFIIKQVQIFEMGNALLELGFAADNLTEQLLTYFNVKNGILIVHVEPNSSAAQKGIKAGDIIVTMNGTPVTSTIDFRTILDKSDDISFKISRRGTSINVVMKKKKTP